MIVSDRRQTRDGDPLGQLFVLTDLNRPILKQMAGLVTDGYDPEACLLLSILGPPRCGKTSLIRGFDQACERGENGCGPVKILEVQVPTRSTLMRLVTNMLRALRDPAADYGTVQAKTGRAARLLERGKYDVIAYDEIHRVVEERTDKAGNSAAEFISDMLNLRICPAIGIGEPSFNQLLATRPYLDGRSFGIENVKPCDWAVKADRMAFRSIVNGTCKRLGLPNADWVSTHPVARRISLFAGGRIGYAANLLKVAKLVAQQEGHSELTMAHLRQAADRQALQSTGPGFNPFSLDEGDARLWNPDQPTNPSP